MFFARPDGGRTSRAEYQSVGHPRRRTNLSNGPTIEGDSPSPKKVPCSLWNNADAYLARLCT